MKLSVTLPALALLALTAAAPAYVATASNSVASNGAASNHAAVDGDDHEALEEAMETLKAGQRAVKKAMGDPAANEAELMKHLEAMEAATLTAIPLKAEAPDGLAGKDLARWKVGYRAEMVKLLTQILAMQDATLAGDAAALQKGYDALVEVKKTGHEDFRVDD